MSDHRPATRTLSVPWKEIRRHLIKGDEPPWQWAKVLSWKDADFQQDRFKARRPVSLIWETIFSLFCVFFFLPSAAWHLVYFNFLSSHFLKYTFALPHQTLSLLLKAKPLLKTFLWTCKQLDLRTTWKSKWTGGFSGAGGWGEGSGKLLIKGHKFQLCRMSEFWILAVQLCRYSQQYCTPETNVILYINYTSIKLFLQ